MSSLTLNLNALHYGTVELSPVTGHLSFFYMTLKFLIVIYSFLNRGWVDFRFSKQYPFGLTFSEL